MTEAPPFGREADIVFAKTGLRAVILGGGEEPAYECLAHWVEMADFFFAADWAALTYERLPRRPDAIIGDLDTMMGKLIGADDPPFLHIEDQETTDTEKALLHALDLGCREAVLLGATGRRLDHTLYNLSLVEGFADRMRICVANEHCTSVRIGAGESVIWDLPAGTTFSLAPLASPALLGEVTGARWPVSDEVLIYGGDLSISNKVAAPPLRIEVYEGSVLASIGNERLGLFLRGMSE
ncbi:thiamine diphosphokinase [bacterium]|nr:thiamine diphosphokinase [bacterium]MBU1674229.1 thiamine diphosphokinase [bacterium]